MALELLEELFSEPSKKFDVRATIYNESSDEHNNSKWPLIATYCEDNGLSDLSLEITSAQIVKDVINQALGVIALDEKDQFNFYT